MSDDYISASEVSAFLYCHRSWWYKLQGVESASQPVMDAGTQRHEELVREVHKVESGGQLATRLVIIGVVLMVLFLAFKLSQGA